MLFPFSLKGAAQIWLEKEPPRSIFTWDDLVSKIINQFLPPSKTTNLHNEITNFQQRFDESFSEAWDRFKDLLRACPHHGFSELHQLDTFYNALNLKDQDSLNSADGGNILDKMPHECLAIIESKSKVRYSHNKPVVAKVSMNTSTSGISPDVAKLKDMVKALLLDKNSQNQAPATVKAVEESCVTCGGGHSYRNCPATDGIVYRDNIQEFVYQASIVVENEPEATKDTMHPTNNGSTEDVQPQNKLFLPDLSPMCMTLELANHSISRLVGVAEDVYVKVGTFHFSTDFVVVNFDANPRVPLTLRRSFLKTGRAIIDVFEEYSQEVLGFSDVITSGNPTPYYDPIVSTTSPILSPFRNSDFLLEEVDAFLSLKDDLTLPEVDQSYLKSEGDILLLEAFLNDDPSLPFQTKEIICLKFARN
nr:reverse transcriptase domain-containing protein [Tanacetum cinerariifolium]